MVTRQPGADLHAPWHRSGLDQRLEWCRQLGALTARLHAVPPSQPLLDRWFVLHPEGFGGFLKAQQTKLAQDPELAAHPRVQAALNQDLAFLDRRPRAFLHGDLEQAHIFQTNGQISGLIDFGDFKLADPLYELVTLEYDILPTPEARSAFLTAYGRSELTDEEEHILGLYHTLHEWGPTFKWPPPEER